MMNLEDYIAELVVPKGSKAIGKVVKDLYDEGNEHDLVILGVVRNNRRLKGFSAELELREKDMLVVEATAEDIDRFGASTHLNILAKKQPMKKPLATCSLQKCW